MQSKCHQFLLKSHFVFFLLLMRRHDLVSLSGLSVAPGKRSLIVTLPKIILAAGSKEDFPLAEVENFYASLHWQIFLKGIRTIIEAKSQLYSLTGAIN